jgi:hypothetical protein
MKKEAEEFDGSFEGTRLRQILAGLDLNHTERLRWLEDRMTELMKLRGKAGEARNAAVSAAGSAASRRRR